MKKSLVVLVLFCAFFKISAYEDDEDKLKLAVMEIVDTNGTMQKSVLSDATEYLRVAMTSTGKFILIPKERQENAIKKLKRESWQECNDRNCRIPLGQALSADTMLTTKISRIGSTFIIVSQLIDLESESAAIAERKKYDGSEDSLLEALDYIAAQLTKKYVAAHEKEEKIRQEEMRREAEERRRAEMRREAEEKRREEIRRENEKRRREAEIREAEEAREKELEDRRWQRQRRYAEAVDNERSGNLIKKAGYGMLIVGATSMAIGGLCFGLQEDIDGYEDYNDNMVTTGISLLVIGGAAVLTGAILAPVGAVREKNARIELNSLAVAPTKGGMFASVGLNF